MITNTAANTQQTYPLNKDAVLKVKGVVGESVIEIKDGRACFVSSPCQDQICVQVFGWIEKEYQLSFCSPNQILLQIKKEQHKWETSWFPPRLSKQSTRSSSLAFFMLW